MRIQEHPILFFERGKKVSFTYNNSLLEGYEGETIAAALHAAGVRVLSHSHEKNRPRGFFCAIGNCSSCLMEVNGEPNVRICVEMVKDGMIVRTQEGKGDIL
ncbi:(2Fe-2S)-binding protein [Geosporobacter ferrireducens]|uniref:Pyridine nucleotide-disulfide oxidoreductase n=1 Tax=Geosporobacter ferrireducens TaxID=1424294 RepID=A0A1D8GBD0_9FIRM|nr:(2Fe-2S)-binding protein [Geosporobacter ferrireducens]AOT68210.1 pyridine nucleotide-disulfide oxidoreductase [Geosporobacter ferrireducens]MTI54261.1 (2Fe-2S)-binding protein [Geosporobacter ferrireducens]